MKKFECNRCNIYCKLEVDEENPNPTNCIYNGLANWREVKEETKEEKIVRDKLIISLLIDFYFNRCEGIKTETLQKIKDLINWDLEEYYGE